MKSKILNFITAHPKTTNTVLAVGASTVIATVFAFAFGGFVSIEEAFAWGTRRR